MKSNENLYTLTGKHDHDRVSKWFKNFENSNKVRNLWDPSISHDIIWEGYRKILKEFWTIFHVLYLFLETSVNKFRRVMNDMVKFVSDTTFKLCFDVKSYFYK
jgi:hypothetical protein